MTTVNINAFHFLITLQWDRLRPAEICLLAPDQASNLVKEEEVEEGWMKPSPLNFFFQCVLAESTNSGATGRCHALSRVI